jgi:hypothetical protein
MCDCLLCTAERHWQYRPVEPYKFLGKWSTCEVCSTNLKTQHLGIALGWSSLALKVHLSVPGLEVRGVPGVQLRVEGCLIM